MPQSKTEEEILGDSGRNKNLVGSLNESVFVGVTSNFFAVTPFFDAG